MRSQHKFSNVPTAEVPRSSFDLSHSHKTTMDADLLYPICQPIDIIPGDTFNCRTSFFLRLNTMLRPILDNMRFETFAFFVPYRTIWDNHEKFHGAQTDPSDSIDFTIPICSGATAATRTDLGGLWDYFGLPPLVIPDDVPVSCLPFRAMAKIFNDWFRDENLQDSWKENRGNGPDLISANNAAGNVRNIPFVRGKRKDYFTSCLPWPQKGGTGITFGITGKVRVDSVSGIGSEPNIWSIPDAAYQRLDADGARVDISSTTGTAGNRLEVDLVTGFQSTINDLRLAFQTQKLLERDARSGTRYVEALKAHWKVTSPDFRLQRAEFLGGGSSVISLSPVAQLNAQTSPTENDKVGNLAANGTVNGTHSWTKSFVEHGVVIILGNIRGDISYSQGVDRYWSKTTRYEFFYPVLAGIGEQSVLNSEIWITGTGTPATDDLVFGYQERYAEHRFLSSKLTALMRPDAAGTLASWHLSEDFATLPALGATFIEANTRVPLDRAIAVPTQPQFFADFYHEIKAARPLPLYGVPGNIDRF